MFTFMRVPFVVTATVFATACTLGQNYQRPAIQTPSTYRSAEGQPSPASLADLQWFELFRDDTLNGLVKTALQENFELRIAAQRVLQARAAYGITRAGQWPTVDASRRSDRGAFVPGRRESRDTGRHRHRRQLRAGRLQPCRGNWMSGDGCVV